MFRGIAESASKHLGQPVIVENKPGGSATLGPATMAATALLFAGSAPTAAGTAATASNLFTSSLPVNAQTTALETREFHDIYFDYGMRPYTFAPWFSDKYLTAGTSQEFSVELANAASGAGTLTVTLWSLSGSGSAQKVRPCKESGARSTTDPIRSERNAP